ncbi:MAG: MFS transporter [Chloroflexi bacterium]|nr:MFS transporter [Chloroflexota bacterium]
MSIEKARRRSPMLEVLGIRNFRLLWIGQGTSLVGDYFNFIALPWLVLQLTGSALALGTVLALEGVPRALFTLLGGAITDRVSPRTIMLISDIVRFFLCGLLVALVLTGTVNLWALYAIGLAFGLVGGFFQPAAGAVMPTLVGPVELQAANALYQGSSQMLGFVGPMLAGAVIAVFGTASVVMSAPGSLGVAVAFGVDALSFLVSVFTLWLMSVPAPVRLQTQQRAENVLESIRDGIAFVWKDPILRMLFIVIAALNMLFVGPIDVGIPVLARLRLPEGVAAYGIIIAAYAGGNLIGTILSGMIPPRKRFKAFTIALLFAFGLALAPFGWVPSAWVGFTIFFVLGIGNGYFSIILITLLQRRTPPALMGRMMSLLVLSNVGLVPISQAASGLVINASLDALFVGAGGLILIVAVWATLSPTLELLVAEVETTAAASRGQTGTTLSASPSE